MLRSIESNLHNHATNTNLDLTNKEPQESKLELSHHKHLIHQQLKLRYKEFFESKLAIEILKQPELLPSVNKLSTVILKLIQANRNSVLASINTNPNIIKELRSPYFGACFDSKEEVQANTALDKIIPILENKTSDLKNVMQIHCIFVHRIYDQIENNTLKADLVKKIFPESLFNKNIRSRSESPTHSQQLTKQLGITRLSIFSKKLNKNDILITRAMEKYLPEYRSSFFKAALEKTIPVVCGPSGHTGSLMLGASLYGNFTAADMEEYAIASFAFLAAGGNHSFHEVMLVTHILNNNYEENNYASCFSQRLKETDLYKKLSKQFPEFLENEPGTLTFNR